MPADRLANFPVVLRSMGIDWRLPGAVTLTHDSRNPQGSWFAAADFARVTRGAPLYLYSEPESIDLVDHEAEGIPRPDGLGPDVHLYRITWLPAPTFISAEDAVRFIPVVVVQGWFSTVISSPRQYFLLEDPATTTIVLQYPPGRVPRVLGASEPSPPTFDELEGPSRPNAPKASWYDRVLNVLDLVDPISWTMKLVDNSSHPGLDRTNLS